MITVYEVAGGEGVYEKGAVCEKQGVGGSLNNGFNSTEAP